MSTIFRPVYSGSDTKSRAVIVGDLVSSRWRIVAGGEITARYVTPRDPGPDRGRLAKRWLAVVPWADLGWNPDATIADHRRPETLWSEP